MDIRQGDIFWVTILPTQAVGSEQHSRRPFIIVSRLGVNKNSNTVVGVPMTTSGILKHNPPFRIVIPAAEIIKDLSCSSTIVDSVAKTDQVRVLDKARLEDRIGCLSETATIAVGLGLAYLFDLR